MTTIEERMRQRAAKFVWTHAVVFGVVALACYASPETVFSGSAWLPLARLAVLVFAAALVALVVVLIGAARSKSLRELKVALLAALALDAQVPIMMFSQTASLEYFDADLGIPWFLVPLTFLVMVGATVHCFLKLRHAATATANTTL